MRSRNDTQSNSPWAVSSARWPARSMSDSWRLRCSINAAMVPIFSRCSRAKISRSGSRAIVPSSFMISQITAAGVRPAMRARSQPASVWPARISTPPSCACSGKTWPGCTRSRGFAFAATAAWMVRARSAAEMPVVTPSAASIDTVNAVPCRVPLRLRHRRQLQPLAMLARQRQADQAAAESGHEVDRLRRHVLGREHEIAFVLAIFFVDQDDHAARGEVGNELRDGGNRHARIVGGGSRSVVAHTTVRRNRRGTPTSMRGWPACARRSARSGRFRD